MSGPAVRATPRDVEPERETTSRRVLIVSPHFPPDGSAASHRARLLAPHLPRHGWAPTVLAVDPRDCEGGLDPELGDLVSPALRVVRCRALPARVTRGLGVGDLGLRALPGLLRSAARLLRRERFDALLVTIYPTYPALLGPILKRRFGVPFVLDYQDPWVSEWGRTVGGAPDGGVDAKSRLSRLLATRLEPWAVRATDAIVAVSEETVEPVRRRHPEIASHPFAEIPIGGEPADFERLRTRARANPFFDPRDGRTHLCYVGTLLPLGFETLGAVLSAVGRLRSREPALAERLRLHFIGTSNQARADAPARVMPIASALGVGDLVREVAPRVGYLDALTAQAQAGGILLMGSSERHYTASKLYPALLARRPIVAVHHRESTVVDVLRRAAPPPAARVVTYDDGARAASQVEAIAGALGDLLARSAGDALPFDASLVAPYTAGALAGRLAGVLDRVARPLAARRSASR